jgi:hypothetical protein
VWAFCLALQLTGLSHPKAIVSDGGEYVASASLGFLPGRAVSALIELWLDPGAYPTLFSS